MIIDTIKLSIAIVTRNRPDSLRITLEDLKRQDTSPYEIVISDDSSVPEAMRENAELAREHGCIYFSGPQRGLYANRNFVARKCSGTHIRTMDDDHTFPQNHLFDCISAINEEPDTIWTIGECGKNDDVRKIPGQLHPRGYGYIPRDFKENEYYGISCGGSIYPIKVITDGILNSEFYKFGIVYLEYGARLKFLGYKIKLLRTTYLIHNDIETSASFLSPGILNEARMYSIMCYSFLYRPSLKNIVYTSFEILKELIFRRILFEMLANAYRNYKETKRSLAYNGTY